MLAVNDRRGQLTLIAPERRRVAGWLCRCDCGRSLWIASSSLKRNKTCGCGQRRAAAAVGRANLVHGQRRSPEYRAWVSMLQRCENPKHRRFADWGGRGIRVCQRWRESFLNFLADMGARPTADLSLDRIDNDGDYEPGNCRWATKRQQVMNRRIMLRREAA